MDEHHLCLPDHLSPDGLTPDEHTEALIDDLAAWSFAWDDERNLVMLCSDADLVSD